MVALLIGGTVYLAQAAGREPAASADDAVLIPQDSIRIRIIAQSDSEEDQAIKRAVKGRVSDLIVSWGELPDTLPEARAYIEARLPDVRSAAESALKDEKASYGADIELAEVPFPEKTFEGTVYPAADYEALRITLGDGQGANWWCVLFPPLCLTAATAKEEAPASNADEKVETKTTQEQKIEKTSAAANADEQEAAAAADTAEEKPKAKFFLAVLLEKLFSFLSSLF